MRLGILFSFLLIAISSPSNAQSALFEDVHVVDVKAGELLRNYNVLVEDGQITRIGPVEEVNSVEPDLRVEGRGRYLLPGLWDMHGHTSSEAITRQLVFPVYIAHGMTGIRDLKGDCFSPCWELSTPVDSARLRESEIRAGKLLGPRVVASSAMADGLSAYGSLPTDTPERAREFVRQSVARGVAFIKTYDGLPREAYIALVDEANRLKVPVAGHLPVAVSLDEALRLEQRSIEHLGGGNILDACSSREAELRAKTVAEISVEKPDFRPIISALVDSVDWDKCDAAIARWAASDTWSTPTLVLNRYPGEMGMGNWRSQPQVAFLHPADRDYWEADDVSFAEQQGTIEERRRYNAVVREIARRMHSAGVRFLAGSDAGVPDTFWGLSLHQELVMLVSIGMSPAEALRSATLGPAQFLGREHEFGTIEEGKLADLVLLERNPLEDIANTQSIAGVMIRGRFVDRDELDGLLAQAEAFVDDETERLTGNE